MDSIKLIMDTNNKVDKVKLIMGIALLICIVIISIYGINNYQENLKEEFYNKGVNEVVSYIVSETSQCKQLPLSINDISVNLISLECIQNE